MNYRFRYLLVCENTPTLFLAKVNGLMADGYRPHGSPSIVLDGTGYPLYYQAMVISGEDEADDEN